MSTAPRQRQNQMASAEVIRLGDTVNCQEGAVVSRTLIKHPTGTITAFAFDAGQGLSEHRAAYDALVQMIEGKAEITISGRPFQLEGAEAILLPAPMLSQRSLVSRCS
jgi:quercetin dioxygenase-like cupin family protein